MNTSGQSLLALTTKQPSMSSTNHGGGKRRSGIGLLLWTSTSGIHLWQVRDQQISVKLRKIHCRDRAYFRKWRHFDDTFMPVD
jgi:hypothetical protein